MINTPQTIPTKKEIEKATEQARNNVTLLEKVEHIKITEQL